MIPPQQGLPFSPRLPDLVEVGGFDSQRDQFLAFHDANPHVLGAVLDRSLLRLGWLGLALLLLCAPPSAARRRSFPWLLGYSAAAALAHALAVSVVHDPVAASSASDTAANANATAVLSGLVGLHAGAAPRIDAAAAAMGWPLALLALHALQAALDAGTEGATAEVTFSDGLAFFQIVDKGLMANADIAGTKYWKSDKLNGTN